MEIYRSVGVTGLVALMAADRQARGQAPGTAHGTEHRTAGDRRRDPASLNATDIDRYWRTVHAGAEAEQPVG